MKYKQTGKCLLDSFKNMLDKLWPKEAIKEKKTFIKSENSKELLEMIYKINPLYDENQELLINFFLMRLHNELNKCEGEIKANEEIIIDETNKDLTVKLFTENFGKNNMSLISDLFFGTYYSNFVCNICGHNGFNFQSYIYGFYSLSQVFQYKYMTCQNNQNTLYMNKMINLKEINIYDCLYFDQQIKSNFQICNSCHKRVPHNFQNNIYIAPEIYSFVFNKNDLMPNINFLIEKNINIILFSEVKINTKYELIGVIYYFSPNRYISYCYNVIDNKWYCYDDENVKIKDSFQEVISGNYIPYMLFYKNIK